ncbi:hypothetical protein [Amycolatopsis sp. NPDC051903]|uniref:hypothetical protein n=1 Tax=Amycolatopsis sp. NPDC051903 TaxID=3363936 RepID=UPI0037BA21AD
MTSPRATALIASAAGCGVVLAVVVAVLGAAGGWSTALWVSQLAATVLLAAGAGSAAALLSSRRRAALTEAELVLSDLEITVRRVERLRRPLESEPGPAALEPTGAAAGELRDLVADVAGQLEDLWFARVDLAASGRTDSVRRLDTALGRLGIGHADFVVLASNARRDRRPGETGTAHLARLLFGADYAWLGDEGGHHAPA